MVSLFCRHNRFTADCPICSRGTVLDPSARDATRRTAASTPRRSSVAAPERSGGRGGSSRHRSRGARSGEATAFRGPSATAGPYERDGQSYEVRLERVPGGLRLAEWAAAQLRPRAPVLALDDLPGLLARAGDAGALAPAERDELLAAVNVSAVDGEGDAESDRRAYGASPGRSGELRDELRVERVEDRRVRLARWVHRPGTGWDMLDAPTMLPARRYAEALGDAARAGALTA